MERRCFLPYIARKCHDVKSKEVCPSKYLTVTPASELSHTNCTSLTLYRTKHGSLEAKFGLSQTRFKRRMYRPHRRGRRPIPSHRVLHPMEGMLLDVDVIRSLLENVQQSVVIRLRTHTVNYGKRKLALLRVGRSINACGKQTATQSEGRVKGCKKRGGIGTATMSPRARVVVLTQG